VSALNLPDGELNALREGLLNHIAHLGVSTVEALHDALRTAGHEAVVQRVQRSDVIRDHPYAALSGDPARARRALDDLLRRGLHQSMLVELEDAKAAMIEEPSPANHARLAALKEAVSRMAGGDPDMSTDHAGGGGSFF